MSHALIVSGLMSMVTISCTSIPLDFQKLREHEVRSLLVGSMVSSAEAPGINPAQYDFDGSYRKQDRAITHGTYAISGNVVCVDIDAAPKTCFEVLKGSDEAIYFRLLVEIEANSIPYRMHIQKLAD